MDPYSRDLKLKDPPMKDNFSIAKDFSTQQSTLRYMERKLAAVMPHAEILIKAELVRDIHQLKTEKNAMILGHNYMEPALFHTVTDICGDSLQLARLGAQAPSPILVVCGVRFMAETAKILSPEKTVLLPSPKAGCSLASAITGADVRELKKLYPGVPVVSYVNTYADVKAESDICCTSSNARSVIEHLDSDTVIFIPDQYLAANMARETGRRMIVAEKSHRGLSSRAISPHPAKKAATGIQKDHTHPTSPASPATLISWPGFCEVHEQFTLEDIAGVRQQFGPEVAILAHPECSAEVCEAADFSGSTSAMIQYVQKVEARRYLLLTECAMADNIIAENPQKELLRMCSHRCPHMATITLEMTLHSLEHLEVEIHIEEQMRQKAQRALQLMVDLKVPAPSSCATKQLPTN